MNINIDEDKLKEYIETAVNQKIDTMTDEIIKKRVQEAISDKVNGIFSFYDSDIRRCVDKHVHDIILEKVKLNPELFDKTTDRIASSIAFNLKEQVIESIAYRLVGDDTDNDSEYDE